MTEKKVYVHPDRPGVEIEPYDDAHEARMVGAGWTEKPKALSGNAARQAKTEAQGEDTE